jgi:hypothetical protein
MPRSRSAYITGNITRETLAMPAAVRVDGLVITGRSDTDTKDGA